MPTLADLVVDLARVDVVGGREVPVTGISHNSRRVQPGDLFVAVRGQQTDGHRYIADAVRRGAAAVLLEDPTYSPTSVPSARVPNARLALAYAAAAFYGYPSRKLRLVGVTGTDGKTTTTYLTAALLRAAGYRTGIVSTVDVQVGDEAWRNDTSHTTPQAPDLQGLLAKMVAAGVQYAVIEVSSHSLALDRVATCDFDVAIFTNLTPEHLNFHGSFEEYGMTKARLFGMLGEAGPHEGAKVGVQRAGVVNADDPTHDLMAAACPVPIVSYGIDHAADIVARDVRLTDEGSRFVVAGSFGEVEVSTPLRGLYNVSNWLAAIEPD